MIFNFHLFLQEQPLLLEELLEQEKQEQARNIGTNQMDIVGNVQNQQSLFSDQVCRKLIIFQCI